MEKSYDPKSFEDEIYKEWEDEGCFRAERDDNKVPFTIMMPPPNITGQLHMGHALDETYQDTLIRFKRMQGYCALWLPGTDHASIATEVKIVEQLRKQGIEKDSLTREEFLKYAWEWKEKYGGRIVGQLKKLGASCDWSRLAFTMDEKCSRAVREVFVNLYNKGLIYHGNRIINWCPECRTALSDAEVEYVDENSFFWHIKYFIEGSDTEGLIVATTRPETMFGDTAVAVNPDDERYKKYIGKNVVMMPSFVNIGAYVDEGTMIDTWATVGSCAQIGKHVHLSGGVGIGGVLEPMQANPTIIEDNCFIGARSEIVEGVIVEENSVISMGVYIGQATRIYDRENDRILYGRVPSGSVVVPGNLPDPGGKYSLYCAVIVKRVDAQTRAKTAINDLLRDN